MNKQIITLFFAICALVAVSANMRAGGLSDSKPADDEIVAIVNQLRDSIESELGKALGDWSVHSYKTQVVAGINYFVNIKNDNEYFHAKIFKPLPHTGRPAVLTKIEPGKTETDEITYF